MNPSAIIHHGDCRDIIAAMQSESVDAIVTDPPYEIGFMGKGWDDSGIAYNVALWRECLRVLKPGGHLLSFGAARTSHRMATAIEAAGFEIRDSIVWLYGSGFPKSHDVSKGIDKAAGAERTKYINPRWVEKYPNGPMGNLNPTSFNPGRIEGPAMTSDPATDAARQWEGWGTALKPAHEPIVVARKPLSGTVAANVQQYGTGAINIDGTRIGNKAVQINTYSDRHAFGDSQVGQEYKAKIVTGRWPANVITDGSIDAEWVRFFYCAKASKAERNAGLEALPDGLGGSLEGGNDKRKGDRPQMRPTKNTHPTVKPLALMCYLVRLVTPPGGTVLEPFAGSGTTIAAAILEGFDVIGCEMTDEYLPIIDGRIAWAHAEREREDSEPKTLFGGEAA
jgi:site-specific DNA-methyltransferase (adenine-specific)